MDDNDYERKLLGFIEGNNIRAEQFVFNQSCHSVAEAAVAANANPSDFVKSICLIATDGQLIVAVVKGEDRASLSLVAKELGISNPRIANPDEMLKITGYPCGGTPPFGYDAIFLIDRRVTEKTVVYAGGGSERSLIKISVKELLDANSGRIGRIAK